ncbi:MAG: class I SAM-dependent methyltransferase [Phycisphaera sp.]|nr:MAG: class I SAM-dependent methyltransferase [Phycisphaera sp.]
MTERTNRKPWELNPTSRFDNRAELYAKYRPSYPSEAIDRVLEGLGAPSEIVAADIGAGTGIVSRLLAERGVRVQAVEPNEGMRASAESHELVTWVEGTAESTMLSDKSVGLVTSCQAWHWFEPVASCAEVARILKPGGRLALLWYDDKPGDEPSKKYRQIVRPGAVETFGIHAVEQWEPSLAPPFDAVDREEHVFDYSYRLDFEGLIGRARSASYVPHEGPDAERLVEEMKELHREHADSDGCITMGLICVVHIMHRPD